MSNSSGFIKYFGALVMEKNGDWKVSVGRISWWLLLLPALYIWVIGGKDIGENYMTALITLATYNFGKKFVDGLNTYLAGKTNKKVSNEDGPG